LHGNSSRSKLKKVGIGFMMIAKTEMNRKDNFLVMLGKK
jgi:hypothetical protein